MANSQNAQSSTDELKNCFNKQRKLYDLHTHLLGMGDTRFWIKNILMKKTILPTNKEFRKNATLRQQLCRLVWDPYKAEFIHGKNVDLIFECLIKTNYPNGSLDSLSKIIHDVLPKPASMNKTSPSGSWEEVDSSIQRVLAKSTPGNTNQINKVLEELKALVQPELAEETSVFYSMVEENNKFARELRNRGLTFKEDFSYDVVLKLNDLASGLGVTNRSNEFIQAAVEEKLGFYMKSLSGRPQFRHWIIFNARTQCFEVVYGITVEQLRKLIDVDTKPLEQANELAHAHIMNAFSMVDAQGTDARPIDFHSFQGMFTPEFFPRRFALKDSIYSQRLDVLARLLYHVLHNYDTCHPPVTYCELSVGVGDVTRPWVFDVLCSIPTSDRVPDRPSTTNSPPTTNSMKRNSFRELFLTDHFPNLRDIVTIDEHSGSHFGEPKCTYKFLAGFNRQHVRTSFFTNQKEAIDFLNETPQTAIYLMLNEINKNVPNEYITGKSDMFYRHVVELKKVEKSAKNNEKKFYHWVVGFDLFGDEMGFPYCPFVARDFINYVLDIRKEHNPSFGLRVHCGENVPFADATAPAYRHFAAHMYIVFRCLRYLQHELKYGIRIGHGIAFQRILDGSMSPSKHRKSSVLLAEIQNHAQHVFKTIAFEVNITSNEYLLGQALRQGDYQRALQLDALLDLDVPLILATDNDGIWPITKCPCGTRSHFSLSSEYCRAISTRIIKSQHHLEKMFENMKKFRFYSKDSEGMNVVMMPSADISILPHDIRVFTVIIHPDIIKLIMSRCREEHQTKGRFYDDFKYAYPSNSTPEINNIPLSEELKKELKTWKKTCFRLAPIAYMSYCAHNSETQPALNEEMRYQYKIIFKNGPDVFEVLREWENVYQQLIEPNIMHQSQCVSTNSTENVFFSEGSLTSYEEKERPMKDLIDYLQRHYHHHKKVHIHAFARHINVKATVAKIEEQLKRVCNPQLRVSIYSNKDKDQYEDFDLSNRIQLEINQTSSKRIDPNNKHHQNGLYAVCPHASAATAFLHLISKELSNTDDSQEPVDDHSTQLPETANGISEEALNNSAVQMDHEIQSSALNTGVPLPNIVDKTKSTDTSNTSSAQDDNNIQSSISDTHVQSTRTTQSYHHDDGKRLSTTIMMT